MTFSPKVWGDVLRRLQDEIPDFAFDAWIAPLAVKTTEDHLLLGCPTGFHRDRIRQFYADSIRKAWLSVRRESGLDGVTPDPIEILAMKEFLEARGATVEIRLPIRRVRSTREPVAKALASGASPSSKSTRHTPEPDEAPTSGATAGRTTTPRLQAVPDRKAAIHPTIRTGTRHGPSAPRSSVPSGPSADERGLDEDAQPELPFSFESFVVGPCNALAREAALALARRRQRSLNQLYLGGETGMGKTHLARATATEARRHGRDPAPQGPGDRGARVVYTSAEEFTSDFVTAMRLGQSEEWKRRYRGPIRMLIVEDVQFLSGRTKTQLELFHTVQHVLDAGGNVLLTGDRAPRDLSGLDERMRDQVGRGFVAELEMPDALVRRHILRAKASAGGVHLPPDCLDLLVESSTGSVRDIESVLIQVVTTASLLGRTIDIDLTREAIDLKTGAGTSLPPKTLTPSEIVRVVASFFGKRPEALASRSRRRDVLIPRQLAMVLAHRHTDASFTEIGRELGRDHPSVRNAITRIERLVLENAPLRYQVEALSERVDQLRDEKGSAKTD